MKTGGCPHVTGWTCKHWDLNRLCPKFFPIIGLWPLHFKHSRWWIRRRRSEFASPLRLRDQRSMWMQDGCKVYMDSYVASSGSCFMVAWIVSKTTFGGRPNTKPGDHGTPNVHNRWFILFYHAWMEIHWNSIWLRAWSHRSSHYIWGSATALHDFGGVLGRMLDTFFWALTIPWS